MKYGPLIIATLLLITGCTSVDFVRKDTAPHKQGVLRHAPPSSASKAEKYRQKIDQKATEFCGGKYRITKEYQARDFTGSSTGVGTGLGFGMGGIMVGTSSPNHAMYNFVEFSCEGE